MCTTECYTKIFSIFTYGRKSLVYFSMPKSFY